MFFQKKIKKSFFFLQNLIWTFTIPFPKIEYFSGGKIWVYIRCFFFKMAKRWFGAASTRVSTWLIEGVALVTGACYCLTSRPLLLVKLLKYEGILTLENVGYLFITSIMTAPRNAKLRLKLKSRPKREPLAGPFTPPSSCLPQTELPWSCTFFPRGTARSTAAVLTKRVVSPEILATLTKERNRIARLQCLSTN